MMDCKVMTFDKWEGFSYNNYILTLLEIVMGYSTDFSGEFEITNGPLDTETLTLLKRLAETRRMKRKGLGPEFGVDGEFYCGAGDYGQDHEANIVDYNSPPSTQPGLWCQWEPDEAGTSISWNGAEKFYAYVEWIEYLIDKILAPAGYKLKGEVLWIGEDPDDRGKIIIKNNVVKTKTAHIVYK